MILLITEQGATLKVEAGKIIIEKESYTHQIPKELVENVSVFGNIHLQMSFIRHCLTRHIPINYFSSTGSYFGRTTSNEKSNINILKKQIEAIEDENFRKEFGKIIIDAKVHNQITLLRRHKKLNEEAIEDEIEQIQKIKRKITTISSIQELMGYEGVIAKHYYKAISTILPKDFKFEKRTRRPPKDPFNSMISLGYTILSNEIIGQIESVGLSPYGGIVHGHRRNHPSLASDLIEEVRSVLVDSFVIQLIINQKTNPDDFKITDEGVFLESKFLKIFLKEFQEKMAIRQKYLSYLIEPTTYRKTLFHQTVNLVRAIEEKNPKLYEPIKIR